MNRFIVYVMCCFIVLGCTTKGIHTTSSYYYWKTTYKESDILPVLHSVQKLYVRITDIDLIDGKPKPFSPIQWQTEPTIPIIPVIYITNRTIEGLHVRDIDTLARNIVAFASSKTPNLKELQIDCDWTITTKDKYFDLLKSIKSELVYGQVLSATIRLHQLKFQRTTGVPPIDHGTLMLYNMAALRDFKTANSIFDPNIIDSYLNNISSYPLMLDLALPLYRQVVVFTNKKYAGVIRDPHFFDPKDTDNFVHNQAYTYRCVRDTTIHNTHINEGDQIRVETPNKKSFDKYCRKIAQLNHSDTLNVIYFDIHSQTH